MEAVRKNSKKRQAVLSALCGTKCHPTAEMIYRMLKPDYPELSLGTVYRNLSVLMDEGQIIGAAHVDGQERYDARTDCHAHFVCRSCKRVIDVIFEDRTPEMYRQMESEMHCRPERHTLVIDGLCEACALDSEKAIK